MIEVNDIAAKLKVDLTQVKKMSKESWKNHVKSKIIEVFQEESVTEIRKLKGYRNNVKDEIEIGKKKKYMRLSQKKAKIWFRMQTDIIDPAPRQPYHPLSKWKCKLCDENVQSTEHYVKKCKGIQDIFQGICDPVNGL